MRGRQTFPHFRQHPLAGKHTTKLCLLTLFHFVIVARKYMPWDQMCVSESVRYHSVQFIGYSRFLLFEGDKACYVLFVQNEDTYLGGNWETLKVMYSIVLIYDLWLKIYFSCFTTNHCLNSNFAHNQTSLKVVIFKGKLHSVPLQGPIQPEAMEDLCFMILPITYLTYRLKVTSVVCCL